MINEHLFQLNRIGLASFVGCDCPVKNAFNLELSAHIFYYHVSSFFYWYIGSIVYCYKSAIQSFDRENTLRGTKRYRVVCIFF